MQTFLCLTHCLLHEVAMSQTNIAAVYYYAKLGQIVVSIASLLFTNIISYMYVMFQKKITPDGIVL
jgi:hypothetical protein